MKKIILSVIVFSIASVIASANTEGFKADISLVEASKQFKKLNIGSLAVGEKGLIKYYTLNTCVENGIVKVSSLSELDTEPNDYTVDYEVSKDANNSLSIIFSEKGKKATEEDVQYQVLSITKSEDCKKFKEKNIPLLDVNTLFGAKSLKKLVSRTTDIVESSESSTTQTDTEKNTWLVLKDKSPIDDSPSVSMFKDAKDGGGQTLILRCKENKTEAFISTSDHMGFGSSATKKMMVRFDDKKAVKQSIFMSTDAKALFFRASIKKIKKMIESKKMIVRYYPYGGGAKTATFDLGNLKEEIIPLRDACHW